MNWVKVSDNLVDFTVPNLDRLTPLLACKHAIQSIISNYPKPYNLMVSGGIDSQAMLYAWYLFGENYIPTTVTYNNDFNLHDIDNIKNFAEIYNIPINYKNFDLLYFLQNEYDSYSAKFRCSSPCISAHIKMSEDLQGTVIFSGDFLNKKGAVLSDAILGLYRASLVNKNIIPYFFLHTPELAYSINYKKIEKIPTGYDGKAYVYQQNGFPVIPQLSKTTGFEKVKDYYDKNFFHLVPKIDRLKYATKPSRRTFDLLYRYPYEEKYNNRFIFYKVNNI